jgi:hypothetical protein
LSFAAQTSSINILPTHRSVPFVTTVRYRHGTTRHAVTSAVQHVSAMRAAATHRQWHAASVPLILRRSPRRAANTIIDSSTASPTAFR